ncbi:DNA internalization-related competence protein ComEC/Rec2 [Tissierella pigra]|uniref:DNA internalization-related competence protein ComEC/Rec2 n=1 Tax=Tissierella pigra TaxID=2607614 RepID=UPI001C12145F|nr:DNA internalization-related competence protein ComEC/Rec2 [Tissierella pigra]MBU5427139.1 DNA internalization-related competence protein ComEC/Rec2 [Tissierella pigra]
MKRPFVFITIPFILGIVFSYYIEIRLITILIFLFFILILYIINFSKDKSNNIFLLLILFTFGIILAKYNLNNSFLISKEGEEFLLRGIVDDVVWKEEGEGKYIVEINRVGNFNIKEKTVLKIRGDKQVSLGDKLIFKGKINVPLENTNPMLFNYKRSLLSNKLYTTININDYSILEIERNDIPLKYKMKLKFKERIENLFNSNLSEENSSLMKSIVLGEYNYLDEKNISKYRDLGLAHILAVSGLHIGIISSFLVYIFSHLGIKRKINIFMTLIIIWFYGYLIGFPPSLLRANIMFSIIFIGQAMAEPYDSINSLFFAMLILLIINPMWIFNLGFQLSFLASFSIIYFTPKIKHIFYLYKNKLTYTLSGLLAVQIGLFPVQAYYFNKISIMGILANLIIAPILSFSLIIGAVMVGLSYSLDIFIPFLGKILNLILSIQFRLIDILYKFPFGIIKYHSPSIGEFILYYIFILILFKVIKVNKISFNLQRIIIYYLVFFLVFNFIILLNDKSVNIHFIDVGQGDGILIQTNRDNYLVDTGGNIMDSFDIGKNITLPYLEKIGVNKIKGVFITHFDEDHCKSLPLLMENIKIKNILLSYENHGNKTYDEIKNKNIPIKILKENDLIYLDNNTYIKVLSPNESIIRNGFTENNKSLVFILSNYNKNILFTGDIEKEVELELFSKIEDNIDIIKVPHHGSNTSSTDEFLEVIQPSTAIISVGRNNLYGHPRNEVLERYISYGTEIYRTDTMGRIKVVLNKGDIKIESFIKEKPDSIDFLNTNFFYIIFYIIYYLLSYILIKFYLYLEGELKTNEL